MNLSPIDQRILALRKAVANTEHATLESLMELGAVDKSSIAFDSQGIRADWNNDWTQFNQWVNE